MATYFPGFLKRPPVAAEGIHVQPEVQQLRERQARGQMSRKERRRQARRRRSLHIVKFTVAVAVSVISLHLGVLSGGIVAAWAGSRWVLRPPVHLSVSSIHTHP
jgi:ABC-type Fe3+ transport system permease subunit